MCKSGGDKCDTATPLFEIEDAPAAEAKPVTGVSDAQRNLVKELLHDYKKALEEQCVTGCFTAKHFVTGISDQTITEILQHLQYISSMDYVIENLPLVTKRDVLEVLYIINDVFDDIDLTSAEESMNTTNNDFFRDVPENDLLFGSFLESDIEGSESSTRSGDELFQSFSDVEHMESSDEDLS